MFLFLLLFLLPTLNCTLTVESFVISFVSFQFCSPCFITVNSPTTPRPPWLPGAASVPSSSFRVGDLKPQPPQPMIHHHPSFGMDSWVTRSDSWFCRGFFKCCTWPDAEIAGRCTWRSPIPWRDRRKQLNSWFSLLYAFTLVHVHQHCSFNSGHNPHPQSSAECISHLPHLPSAFAGEWCFNQIYPTVTHHSFNLNEPKCHGILSIAETTIAANPTELDLADVFRNMHHRSLEQWDCQAPESKPIIADGQTTTSLTMRESDATQNLFCQLSWPESFESVQWQIPWEDCRTSKPHCSTCSCCPINICRSPGWGLPQHLCQTFQPRSMASNLAGGGKQQENMEKWRLCPGDPWRPRSYVMTVAIVAAVAAKHVTLQTFHRGAHATLNPPLLSVLYMWQRNQSSASLCKQSQEIYGNVPKVSKSQKVVINQCIKLALQPFLPCHPSPTSAVHVLGCDETPASRSTGGQVRHLGQGMHTAVTSRVHCPRFKEFKDVAREWLRGLMASQGLKGWKDWWNADASPEIHL